MTEEQGNNSINTTDIPFDPSNPDALFDFLMAAPRPVAIDTLAVELAVEDDQRAELEEALARLAGEGRIVETRDHRYGIPARMNLVVGRLQCHEKGFGFVVPRDPEQKDLYIPRRKLGDAMHADLVVARLESSKGERGEGRVIRVLKRARTQVVGKFESGKHFGFVVPLDSRIGYQVYIPETKANGAKAGQLVCAEITSYPEAHGRRNPEGKILEVLGDADDPRIDIEVIIREFGLSHEFPKKVLAEAKKISTEVTDEDCEGREDFRELPVVTIDGETAKDFDDAVYVEKLANGNYKLAVHIADVSAYVAVGSAIDDEAQLRATSVYFPDRVVPMLPESLSNEICSLKPGVDRLVQSVVIEITPSGRTVNYELFDGVVRSAERMTYKQVAAILDGSDAELAEKYAAHVDHFKRMGDLCAVLRRYRNKRGSIDFDLPEPDMRIDMCGEVTDILRSERNEAHRLIEEFMIRANEVVASHMTWEDVPNLYRAHEGPDLEKVEAFREFIGGLGLQLGGGKNPKPKHFQQLVEHLDGQPGERVIIYLMLRTMKQARYQPDNTGHFGLASPRYGHFTSPIRRYPDLVTHRLLKADLGSSKQKAFDVAALQADLRRLGVDCSERERNAESAERRYKDWKTVQFMADKLGDTFEAFVTSVHSYGLFVELDNWFVDGLVAVSSLDDDYYQFDERKHTLRGDNTGRTFTLGNKVKVQLVKVDMERRRLDFAMEEGPIDVDMRPNAVTQEAAEQADDQGAHRRRRRRRPRKTDKQDAPAAEAPEGEVAADKVAAADKAAPADGESSGRSSRRRRGARRGRGGRGGRDRSASTQAGDSSSNEQGDGAGSGRRRQASGSRDGGDGRQTKTDGRRRSSGRKTEGRSRSTGRKTEGRGGDTRKRSTTKSATETVKEATVTAPKKASAASQDGAPKVNPYLTDL